MSKEKLDRIYLKASTKKQLKQLKMIEREPYDNVVKRLISFYLEHQPSKIQELTLSLDRRGEQS
jgi:hypothetical protein